MFSVGLMAASGSAAYADEPAPADTSSASSEAVFASIIGDGLYHSISNVQGLALSREGSDPLRRCDTPTGYASNVPINDQYASQRWKFYRNSDNTVTIRSSCTDGYVLTAPKYSGGSAVTLTSWDQSNTTREQKWLVDENGTDLVIRSVDDAVSVRDGAHYSRVLDSCNSAAAANTTVVVEPPSATQHWTVRPPSWP